MAARPSADGTPHHIHAQHDQRHDHGGDDLPRAGRRATAATHQSIAAVETPRIVGPSFMISPAPRKPTPWAIEPKPLAQLLLSARVTTRSEKAAAAMQTRTQTRSCP
jgi:hypothetical protein